MGKAANGIGQPVRAQEDRRLPTGKRALWDGLVLSRRVHAAFVRSPDAHARIRSVEKGRRSRFRAQLAVLIGADCVADGLRPIPHNASALSWSCLSFAVRPGRTRRLSAK
jgi:carbon-monoxide dehydrogenase large subunit